MELLTLEALKKLQGKRIRVIAFGYRGQDLDEIITVDEPVSNQLERAEKVNDHINFPQGSQAAYWKSYMTDAQLEEKATNLTFKNFVCHTKYHNCFAGENVFTWSDADRAVQYEIVGEDVQ